jgi:murein DD-endopeptidase MepM/ murein hydrolase activator NlpD
VASVGGVNTAAGPSLGAAPADRSGSVSLASVGGSDGAGTTAVGMVRRGDRISRDSARQAMSDASGREVGSAKTAEAVQADPGLAKLAASAEKAAKELAKDGWQLPIPPGVYHLTARFGQCSGLWSHCHTGLDFAAPEGTPIHAVANGTITETGWAGAYGNRTVMQLEDGTELWYCHQSEIGVRPGQLVAGGQVIGLVGATGNTTGPHLHLEVRPGGGDPVDPEEALIAHGVRP